MVWSPLNDNDYKTKRRYSNLDKGALKASLLVYIGTKKKPIRRWVYGGGDGTRTRVFPAQQ